LTCAPGKNNQEASHDTNHCWQLHPELRMANSGSKPMTSSSSNLPTTHLVEVSKPIVLDSGATHHLINNPDWFHPTAESSIKISTGEHSNFLHRHWNRHPSQSSRRATLNNTLLVLTLNQSLVSIPWLFKHDLSIQKTSDKGVSVMIYNKFQLLGSLKNNFLEIHSSHFQSLPFTGRFKPMKKVLEAVHMDLVGPFLASAPFACLSPTVNSTTPPANSDVFDVSWEKLAESNQPSAINLPSEMRNSSTPENPTEDIPKAPREILSHISTDNILLVDQRGNSVIV
ncbi:hypothetical protein VP01_3620g1, partial [Puccinia sorghi]